MSTEALLDIRGLCTGYSDAEVLHDVDLTVGAGEIVAVLGANGVGKSTLNRTISGVVRAWSGTIRFGGVAIEREKPAAIVARGLIHVPEGRQVFPSLSVLENLEMGAYTAAGRARWQQSLELILHLFPVLAERRRQAAGTLSGGEQQMLAIGRGLASAPKLLMLDEPSMGLAPTVADMIFERIEQIHRDHGLTVLLVEQRVAEALESCDLGYVLETGRVVMQGTHETLMADQRVKTAYLGL